MIRIVFVGYAVNEQLANELSGASVAGNKMQVNILKELNEYDDIELKVFSIYPIASFPREHIIWNKGRKVSVYNGLTAYCVPFINIPLFKQISQALSIYHYAKKEINKNTKVLCFNAFPPIGLPVKWLKKKFDCETCALLADLPIDDDTHNKNFIRNYLSYIFNQNTKKNIKEFAKIIVLNDYAAKIYAPGAEHIVVEGGISLDAIGSINHVNSEKKNIIYSGALTEYSGVLELIKAMDYVTDTSIVLEIYGDGYLEGKICNLTKKKKNVFYMGKVTNREMVSIQKKAYLLVNPRSIDDPISMVTFPSKMFEYMTSGTPVLSTNLNGLTDEYKKYIYLTDGDGAEDIARAINEIALKSEEEMKALAKGAYLFVKEEKNWKRQTAKIKNFLVR